MPRSGPFFKARFPFTPVFEHPIREDDLKQLSKAIGAALPEDYLRFLHQWNGVRFTEFPPRFHYGEYEENGVWVLYGLSDSAASDDVRSQMKAYDFMYRVPSTIIGIGDDGSFNRLCLSLATDTFGHVMYWEPGEAWEYVGKDGERILLHGKENIVTSECLFPVAESFTEFWRKLEPNPEYWRTE